MSRLIPVVMALALAAGCAAAPPVYIQGSARRWTLPLVGPLENAELVVPVTVQGRGPYLFLVDPHRPTSIRAGLAKELDLYFSGWRSFTTLTDHIERRELFEIHDLGAGDLRARSLLAVGLPDEALVFRGGRIDGVLGQEIVSTTIVADVERDGGVLNLGLTGKLAPAAGSVSIGGQILYGILWLKVRVAGKELLLWASLGEPMSLLFQSSAARAGVGAGAPLTRTDWVGARYEALGYGPPVPVAAGPVTVAAMSFGAIPFDRGAVFGHDGNTYQVEFDGLLGQSFFSRFRLFFDRDRGAVHLGPRDRDLGARSAARLARWGSAFASCAAAGCVEIGRAGGEPGAGGAEPPTLVVRRDPRAPVAYEVLLEAVTADGGPAPAPLLRVSLGAGVAEVAADPAVSAPLAAGVAYRVVDASPFALPCEGGGCIVVVPRSPR